MRLIDADALWEIFREKQNSPTARRGGYRFLDDEDRAEYDRLEITLAYIENAPEVDAVPVVRGEWIAEQKNAEYCEFRCSECDGSVGQTDQFDETEVKEFSEWYKYCPNCGAKMEDKS